MRGSCSVQINEVFLYYIDVCDKLKLVFVDYGYLFLHDWVNLP